MRWLVARGRLEEADAVVARVASMNKVAVGESLSSVASKTADKVRPRPHSLASWRHGFTAYFHSQAVEAEEESTFRGLVRVFKSGTLMLRFINCCYCW